MNEFTQLIADVRDNLSLAEPVTLNRYLSPNVKSTWASLLLQASHQQLISPAARNDALDVLGRLFNANHEEVLALTVMILNLSYQVKLV